MTPAVHRFRARSARGAFFGAAALAAAIVLASCAGDTGAPAKVGGRTLARRSVEAGAVSVDLTPRRVDDRRVEIEVTLDTHSGDLGVDLRRAATLTVDGSEWPLAAYTGDSPGGHHRSGVLQFRSGGRVRGEMRLTIDGFSVPVSATWDLKEG